MKWNDSKLSLLSFTVIFPSICSFVFFTFWISEWTSSCLTVCSSSLWMEYCALAVHVGSSNIWGLSTSDVRINTEILTFDTRSCMLYNHFSNWYPPVPSPQSNLSPIPIVALGNHVPITPLPGRSCWLRLKVASEKRVVTPGIVVFPQYWNRIAGTSLSLTWYRIRQEISGIEHHCC